MERKTGAIILSGGHFLVRPPNTLPDKILFAIFIVISAGLTAETFLIAPYARFKQGAEPAFFFVPI
jgi:hypothetical protein